MLRRALLACAFLAFFTVAQAASNYLEAGKPITQAATRPYGCSIKYKS